MDHFLQHNDDGINKGVMTFLKSCQQYSLENRKKISYQFFVQQEPVKVRGESDQMRPMCMHLIAKLNKQIR